MMHGLGHERPCPFSLGKDLRSPGCSFSAGNLGPWLAGDSTPLRSRPPPARRRSARRNPYLSETGRSAESPASPRVPGRWFPRIRVPDRGARRRAEEFLGTSLFLAAGSSHGEPRTKSPLRGCGADPGRPATRRQRSISRNAWIRIFVRPSRGPGSSPSSVRTGRSTSSRSRMSSICRKQNDWT